MEDVIKIKGGRKVVVQKKVFPGYLFVRMALDDDSWIVVATRSVTGFVGNGARPTPLYAPRRSRTSSAPARRKRPVPRRRSARRLVRGRQAGAGHLGRARSPSSTARSPTSSVAAFEADGARQHLGGRTLPSSSNWDGWRKPRVATPATRARRRTRRSPAGRRPRRRYPAPRRRSDPRMAKKKLAAIVEDPDPGPPGHPRRRRWVRRSVRTASTSWTSARRTTPPQTENRPRRGHPADLDLRGPVTTFVTKTPPTPFLLRQAGIGRSGEPARTDKAGRVASDQVRRIAETKMPDLNAVDLGGGLAQVHEHARSDGHQGHQLVRGSISVAGPNRARAASTTPAGGPRRWTIGCWRGSSAKGTTMAKPGKKTVDALVATTAEQIFAPTEALEFVKSMATRNFDESVGSGDPPRRRPPQGRPDDPAARCRCRTAPARLGAGRGVRRRRRRP